MAWQDIPNLAVLFNLLEQVTSLRLWENQWDVTSAQRFVQNEIGIQRTLKFEDDGQRRHDIRSAIGCSRTMLLMTLAVIIAVPVLFILDSDLVTPNTGSSWFQALCCLLPGGLFMFFHERREAIRDFRRSTKEVEITSEHVRVVMNSEKETVFRWRETKLIEGATWFDGETWLIDGRGLPYVFISNRDDEEDEETVLELDYHLSPEIRMLVEKAGQRVLIPQKVAQVVAGREIMGEGWKWFYTVNQQGLRRDEQFVSWDELRSKATPYAIILPEWAHLMHSDPLAGAVAAVARHYIYESK